MPAKSDSPKSTDQPSIEKLVENLSAEHFREWYRERQFRQNIENGQPYFNSPSSVQEPERHSPSKLLQCHRKTVYSQRNAPEERSNPEGIFWFGTRFEEDIIFPFLRDVVSVPGTYVRNTVWVDFSVESEAGQLKIRGATDPLLVDSESVPILPTEIKTKSSVECLDAPNRHHRAQLHAYMAGLSKKYNTEITTGVILYGSRDTLDVAVFEVEFDPAFWNEVVIEWAETQTEYRIEDRLPPGTPEFDWECKFCPYRERCGKGERVYSSEGAKGLLPLYSDYPKEKLIQYLKAHDDAKLTPTLAQTYPELVERYGAFNWSCSECSQQFEWDEIEWFSDSTRPPDCPSCADDGERNWIRGPDPDAQHDLERGNDDR